MSDAEYCANVFGENWEYLIPDDHIQADKTQLFYLFWTPHQQTLKVGKAKNEKNLLLRLQERRRQCGHTIILGFKYLDDPEEEEKIWKEFLSDYAISTESFDLSFCDSDLRWLNNFTIKRQIVENVEREKDIKMLWFGRPMKGLNLEDMFKEYVAWEWDGGDDVEFPTLCDLEPFIL